MGLFLRMARLVCDVLHCGSVPAAPRLLPSHTITTTTTITAGSGKSWSMMGNDEFPGIIPRLNQDLFEYVAADACCR